MLLFRLDVIYGATEYVIKPFIFTYQRFGLDVFQTPVLRQAGTLAEIFFDQRADQTFLT